MCWTHLWLSTGNGVARFDDRAQGWFAGVLGAPTPPPDAFDYRSAEPSFSVYGWTFTADPRRAQEFLDLFGVSRTGFGVRGSGTVSVTTPPLFEPGSTYIVGDGHTVPVDHEGRLRFVVDLGPPHAEQQYTPEARAAETVGGESYWREAVVSITPA